MIITTPLNILPNSSPNSSPLSSSSTPTPISFLPSVFNVDPTPPSPHTTIPPIRFLQNNVHRSNIITHALLNSCTDHFDLLLLQEPWRGHIGTGRSDTAPGGVDIYGGPQQRSWTQFIPVLADAGQNRVARVAAYVSKARKDFSVIQRSDLIEHPDILILELSTSNGPPLLLVNLYNDENNTAVSLLDGIDFPDIPTLITGDFNTRHDLWSTTGKTAPNSARAEQMVEWLIHSGFSLLNRKGEVTYFRRDTQSVLDLSWANRKLLLSGLLSNWRVREDLVFGSDHIPLSWEYHHSPNNVNIPSQAPFVFKEDNRDSWQGEFLARMTRSFPGALLPLEELSKEQLSAATKALMSSLVEASEATTKRARFHPKASPWFTKEISDALGDVRKTRKILTRHKGHWGRSYSYKADLAEYINCSKVLSKMIRKAKKDWAMEFAAKVETKDVWKLTNWFKGSRRHHSPPLVHPDGRRAVTPEDKCNLLKNTFFSSPPPLNHAETAANTQSPHPTTREFVDVTRDEIDRALRSTSNTSAPGPCGVSYRAL